MLKNIPLKHVMVTDDFWKKKLDLYQNVTLIDSFEKFEKAQLDGKTIVIHSWNKNCGLCAKQSKILANAINDFEDVEFLFYEQINKNSFH